LSRHWLCAALIVAAVVGVRTSPQLNVCHAGSVGAALAEVEQAFKVQHPDVVIADVSGGSVALARKLATGVQACDVYASADYLDIDRILKPAGIADYTIVFAQGRMVLAYLTTDPRAQGVAATGDFRPPAAIPDAAPDWYQKLLAPDVRVGGAHPFLDPGGYRSHMILELAQKHYRVANLYNDLLEHYAVVPAASSPDAAATPTLGRDFSFQFSYEHSAAAAARRNPEYRYVHLPDRIDLSASSNAVYYAQASVTLPGLGIAGAAPSITIPASRAAWGVTIIKKGTNQEEALAFVGLLLGPIGTAALNANGPSPVTPAVVRPDDYKRIPQTLQALVTPRPAAP
jgi:molybdate/tungstate transport system substrate-binding protein